MATKYYKLGKKARSFSDPVSKIALAPGVPGQTSTDSRRLQEAQRKGAVTEISKTEYDKMIEDYKAKVAGVKTAEAKTKQEAAELTGNAEPDLNDLSKAQLLERALEIEDLDEKQIKALKKMNKEGLINFIEEHEEEGDEEEEDDDEEDEDDDK